MTYGPLTHLVGTWSSPLSGLDVSFHSEQGKLGETRFREEVTYAPRGHIVQGGESLWALDYRLCTWLEGATDPFHTEIGYWLWDPAEQRIVRCFLVPHATALLAVGSASATDTVLRLEASRDSDTSGVVADVVRPQSARISRFDVTLTVGIDEYTYQQTTVIEYPGRPMSILHTDRNTLYREK